MTISWSFSYNSFVKFHGKKIWEPQHDIVISKSMLQMRSVIKGLHCTFIWKSIKEASSNIADSCTGLSSLAMCIWDST